MSCPCGKEGRYVLKRNGEFVNSCNKYQVCPTYAELEKSATEWRSRAMNAERDLNTLRKILAPKEVMEKVMSL